VVFQIIYRMLCPSNPCAEFIQEKVPFRQESLPRFMASRFPFAGKLVGFKWGSL
jgi:hypothetical protein